MHGRSVDLGTNAMIAATAKIMRLTVATRNTKDFAIFGTQIFNPFNHDPSRKRI
jgi:predicted nucleic acid-binding protein